MKVQQTNWVPRQQSDSGQRRNKWNKWIGSGLALILLAFAAQEVATRVFATHAAAHSMAAPPVVIASAPLTRNPHTTRQFLAPLAAVRARGLPPHVSGTLTPVR